MLNALEKASVIELLENALVTMDLKGRHARERLALTTVLVMEHGA